MGHLETTNVSQPFGGAPKPPRAPQVPQGPPSCGAPPWVALPASAPRFLPAPRSRCPPPTAAAPKGPRDMWGHPLARLATALCALLATRLTAQDPSVANTTDHQVATATFTASPPVATEGQQLATTGALPETSPGVSQWPKSHLGGLVATTKDHQDPVAGYRPTSKSSGGQHEGPEATGGHHHAVTEGHPLDDHGGHHRWPPPAGGAHC
ncbi:uncharacterized protein LOC118261680 isoform X2 [Cygnus atratus]|uniref:uncharacterized protein LOC118261680 isoform X2 n=1 Tax=Cygnus atratus TaxID=8868 RepID=UPI0015D62B4D|nr:uncharacterized protein LOC118261680 isoform X2 [Cygnus atratus]